MSVNNALNHQDGFHTSSPNDVTILASPPSSSSPSTSKSTITPSGPPNLRSSYLGVPSFRPSRPSLDSTYSELSELSFHSKELQTQHPLVRSIFQDATSRPPPRSRIGAALHSFYVTNYGALLVLASQVFGAGMNVSTRLLETSGTHGAAMHPFQIIFARQSITTLVCTTYGIYTKAVPFFPLGPPEARWLLVLRGLFGFFGVFGLYFSLLYLPLSDATVLTFLSPILSCYICSFVIPGQTFSKQQQLAGFISLIGVLFIAQPAALFSSSSSSNSSHPQSHNGGGEPSPSNSTATHPFGPQEPTSDHHLLAIGIAMLGVCGATGAITLIRAIGTRAHAFISINYFSAWCTIVSLVALLVFPDVKFRFPGNLTEWGLLLSLGVCGFVMQFLLTAGLAYGGPSAESHARHAARTRQALRKFRDVESNDTTIPTSASTPERRLSTDLGTTTTLPRNAPSAKPKLDGSGTRATSMVYTQMLFALAGDKFVFGVSPEMTSWIGTVLILAGAIWVASARDKDVKSREEKEDEDDLYLGTGRYDSYREQRQSKHTNSATVDEAEEETGLMNDIDDIDGRGDGNLDTGRRECVHDQAESLELRDLHPHHPGSE
ncbi:uncharacterized protein A1O9_02797 [Exophiala aquamarina CBS 119918]|uniref:EamA domain-containing protein n=1 Tax=Exophiala aquamarina CBS 119918 TaxID=1182545 RepID=A0A072PNB3_9EURO|nr:uncharacterized protein A1O9_02797 [Exophiala aquamarina CBS 119918]KEF61232.1 hypothetical protein A1O9_02797 [Exophiala aquamarina CBS 119918]